MTIECYAVYVANVKIGGVYVYSGFPGQDQLKEKIQEEVEIINLTCYNDEHNRFMIRGTEEKVKVALTKLKSFK